jgi:hypothetical protein
LLAAFWPLTSSFGQGLHDIKVTVTSKNNQKNIWYNQFLLGLKTQLFSKKNLLFLIAEYCRSEEESLEVFLRLDNPSIYEFIRFTTLDMGDMSKIPNSSQKEPTYEQ